MSAPAFTPGPWSVHDDVFYRPVIKAPNGFVVATAKVDFGGCERSSEKDAALDTRKANAHLIAAAPRMYSALDELVELAKRNIYPQPDKPDSDWAKVQRGIEALAQARGEQS